MYNPSLHTATNKPIGLTGKPVDARSYFYDDLNYVYRPYVNAAEVLNYLTTPASRTGQFSIIINSDGILVNGVVTGGTNTEWWFKDIVTDDGLLIKASGGGGIAAWGYINGDIADQGDLSDALNGKVNKTDGYGLSQNDYIDADKALVDTITDKQDTLGFIPENTANKNSAGGYAGLDNSGKVPASLLPSYVDDVIEVADYSSLPTTGEAGKIYVAQDTNTQYRWSGAGYIELVASPGSTDATNEGSTNLYFTAARVLATILTSISFGSSTIVTATDTILTALGKLQAQVTALFGNTLVKSPTAAQIITGGYDFGLFGRFISNYGGRIATWAGSFWSVSGGGFVDLSDVVGDVRIGITLKKVKIQSSSNGILGDGDTMIFNGPVIRRESDNKKVLFEGDVNGIPSVTDGLEYVVTVKNDGTHKDYFIGEQIVSTPPTNADFSTGTANVAGYKGTIAYDINYKYEWITDTSVIRISRAPTVEQYLADIDDSAGAKTSYDLNSTYPAALIGQSVWGAVYRYEKKTSTIWYKTQISAA